MGPMHEYRFNPAEGGRRWAQIEGGGFECGERRFGSRTIVNAGYFPTVMDVRVDGGRLVVDVWDVWRDRIAGRHEFAPRA